jgi:hypothetical protein
MVVGYRYESSIVMKKLNIKVTKSATGADSPPRTPEIGPLAQSLKQCRLLWKDRVFLWNRSGSSDGL